MPGRLGSIGLACALVLAGAPAIAQQAGSEPRTTFAPVLDRADLEAWLDGLVPAALRDGDIAGLVVSVVKDGQIVLEKGYGYADVADRVPMDPSRTVLRVASVSKPFTATAVLQLVEQGTLDLDRDVNEYLDFAIPPAFGAPITLRHLLTHTAGFAEISYQRYVPPRPLREHVLKIPARIYPPGEIPAYSNYGLNLAGYIVERVSGEPIADYVERHILEPLGMQYSTFRMTLPDALRRLAAPTYPTASSAEPYPPDLMAELSPVESPSGGLATTAHDMTRFMLAHLQEGRYEDRRVLRPETLRLMHAPAFVPMPGAQPVALGLFRTDYGGHRVIGHSGDGEGAHAEMKLLPDLNTGIFIAFNSSGRAERFFPAAFTLRAELFEQFVDRYFPAPARPQEPATTTALAHARLAAGEYVWSRQQTGDFQEAFGLLFRFALTPAIRANPDGTIETTAALAFQPNGRTQTWREVAPFVWREVDGDARLLMNVRDGTVQSVWSDQVASFWVSVPVPFRWSAGLHIPLLGAAAIVLLLATLSWPVVALVRRRTGPRTVLHDRERRAERWSRLAAALGALYLAGWGVALAVDIASKAGAEPWIRLLQLIGLLCVAGAAAAVWNGWLVWRGSRGVWGKIRSLVTALALLYLVWFSFAFHLVSVRLG